jgi:hypothetical protein
MYHQANEEVHKWVAQRLVSGAAPDDISSALANANWEPSVVSIHVWAYEQKSKGCPSKAVRDSLITRGWSAAGAQWIVSQYFSEAEVKAEMQVKTTTTIEMRSFEDDSKVLVEVDQDGQDARAGGFGLVCRVEGLDGFLAKRLEVRPPLPHGQAKKYLAHVRQAKARLGDARKAESRWKVREFLDEILNNSLSTHFSYEIDGQGLVAAIWFLLPRASGMDLNEHFRTDRRNPPAIQERIYIAAAFANRMRTLRRPGLIHMDCTVDNIRVDRDLQKLVMIDLDGCGIERQYSGSPQGRRRHDEWDVEPMTLGKQDRVVRVPPWYPQEGVKCGPNAGNYKFGERWIALDTIIRILSWDRLNILGWLEPEVRADLGSRYSMVTEEIAALLADPGANDVLAGWNASCAKHMRECAEKYRPLPQFTAEDAQRHGCPPCLEYFANLAQDAYLEPRVLSGRPDDDGLPRSLYADFSTVLQGGVP